MTEIYELLNSVYKKLGKVTIESSDNNLAFMMDAKSELAGKLLPRLKELEKTMNELKKQLEEKNCMIGQLQEQLSGSGVSPDQESDPA